MDKTQQFVEGTVRVKLYKVGSAYVLAMCLRRELQQRSQQLPGFTAPPVCILGFVGSRPGGCGSDAISCLACCEWECAE